MPEGQRIVRGGGAASSIAESDRRRREESARKDRREKLRKQREEQNRALEKVNANYRIDLDTGEEREVGKVLPDYAKPAVTKAEEKADKKQAEPVAPDASEPPAPVSRDELALTPPQAEPKPMPGESEIQQLGQVQQKIGQGLQETQAGMRQQIGAQERLGEIQQQELDEAARIRANHAQTMAQAMEQKQAEDAALAREIEGENRRIKADREIHAGMTVEPRSIFGDTIGSKVGALFSIFASEIGGALMGQSGGAQTAISMLQKHVDEDMARQYDEIDRFGEMVDREENELMKLERKYGNRHVADQVLRARMYEDLANALEANSAQFASEKQKQNAALLAGGLREKAGQHEIEASQAMAPVIQGRLAAKHKQVALGGGGKKTALSGTNAKIVGDMVSAKSDLAELKAKFLDSTSWISFLKQYVPMTDEKEYLDKRKMVAQMFGKKLEGRMTDEDYSRFLDMLPSPSMSDERAMAAFDSMERMVNNRIDSYLAIAESGGDLDGLIQNQQIDSYQTED